jgi:hypothetical protein
LDEHELAWAAGFFDGDGWAALVRDRRRTKGRAQARINQASVSGVPEVLVRFSDAVGVGRIAGPKVEEGRQPLYRWVASSRADVVRTGSLIGRWLSDQKRRQFTAAVALVFDEPPIDSFEWAAGLFDAEGSVSLTDHRTHPGYRVIEATVTQGSPQGVPEELRRLTSILKLGHINGPYEQEGANELIYRWRLRRADEVMAAMHALAPRLSSVKTLQARRALRVVVGQAVLPRGRPEWGSHKTHCIHGHEYASARVRPYVSRGVGAQRRENKQCLVCAREQARAKRITMRRKIGGPSAADL